MIRHHRKDSAAQVAATLRRLAARGVCDMAHPKPTDRLYLMSTLTCWRTLQALCTRDQGAHASGWWKNPDYDRCLHLSLSFKDPDTGAAIPRNAKLSQEMVREVFQGATRLVWAEPPQFDVGKQGETWHYRVFYADPDFTVPLLPRGEVYTREFTAAGWLSWSDYQAAEEMRSIEHEERTGAR